MPQSRRSSLSSQPDLTSSILVRTSERYQAAERVRRDRGAAWMARQPVDSPAHGAVRLLIGTWDALARSYVVEGSAHDQFFAINPFDLAWAALGPAIDILRKTDGAMFAGEFEKLSKRSKVWLGTPAGRRYRSKGNGGQGGGLFL